MKYLVAILLAFSSLLSAQQTELETLVAASMRLRVAEPSGHKIDNSAQPWHGYENLLRDWLESRLPANAAALDERFPQLETQLTSELLRAKVLQPNEQAEGLGYVADIELSRPDEFPEALLVQASVSVPCGTDGSLYLYRFTGTSRTRLLEAHGTGNWGSNPVDARISTPDALGNRILYASWNNVQCGSNWNELDYRLYRISPNADVAQILFTESHSYRTDSPVNVKLTSDELLLELTAEALEGGYWRTYVLQYRIGAETVQRIDPVALQPQDFVHEWLERPWSEMESHSSEQAAKWHKFLQAEHIVGAYDFVQPCQEHPGFMQAAIAISTMGGQEIPEPLIVYFLVEDKGNYRFYMSNVSFDRQTGCPGESFADYNNLPSLFNKQASSH